MSKLANGIALVLLLLVALATTDAYTIEDLESNETFSPSMSIEVSDTAETYLYILGCILCIVFMVVVLILYLLIPNLRATHGFALPCFLSGLIGLYFSLLILNLRTPTIPCGVQGYLFAFSIILCVLWCNVMCFDCYRAFGGGLQVRNRKDQIVKSCLYGWGCPAVYLVVCLAIENLSFLPKRYKPSFATWGCLVPVDEQGKIADLMYFFLPLSILMAVNIYLLIMTAKRSCHFSSLPDNTVRFDRSCDQERFGLTACLFSVVAISFGLDLLSWAIGTQYWLYYLSSIYVYVQGVVIFFLCICNRHVKRWISTKIC